MGLAGRFDWAGNQIKCIPETAVAVPSDMIAIGDTVSDFLWDGALTPMRNRPEWPYDTPLNVAPSKRHQSGANMVFADGHVEYANQTNWLNETSDARKRWNNDNQPHPENWSW